MHFLQIIALSLTRRETRPGCFVSPQITLFAEYCKQNAFKICFLFPNQLSLHTDISNKDVVSVKMVLKSQRIIYLDWAKTICIFLMVVGHWTSNELLLRYIYSFHMPALFVISGYLFRPHSWIKTIISFCIPVIFCSFINLAFLLSINEIPIDKLLSKEILFRFFHYRYGLGEGLYCGDWFLWALLGLRFLLGDISICELFRQHYKMLSVMVLLYMCFETYLVSVDTIFHGWYLGRLMPSLPFFCMGIFLKEISFSPAIIPKYMIVFFICLFIILPMINGYCAINSSDYGISYALFFIEAICATLLLFIISRYLPFTNCITIISKGTLLILGIHIPLLKLLDMILPTCFDIVIPFVVFICCYFPIIWLDKWCPILLGKLR
jgi:fucose 4-O-acetylase-like acetyltransferase